MSEEITQKIKERLKVLTNRHIEEYPDDYYIRTNNGYGDCGAAPTEDVYDVAEAQEYVIEFQKWKDDDEMCQLFNEFLRSL